MRSLYIHGGLAKTGTTSVQRYFMREQRSLRMLGYDYPSNWIAAAGADAETDGTAHHNVPNEILGHPRYLRECGTNRDLLAHLKRHNRLPNVVLSSEGIASCISKSKKLAKFSQLISAAQQSNERVQIILMFRNFTRLIESWYIQKLKTGRMDVNLDEFIDETSHWLRRLFRNIEFLERTLGQDVFVPIDLARAPSDAVTRLLSHLDVPDSELSGAPARLNERLGLKKMAILHRFQHSRDGKPLQRPTTEVLRLFRILRKLPDFPDEQFEYRLIPPKSAQNIQEYVRKSIPKRWRDVLAEAALPTREFLRGYRVVKSPSCEAGAAGN